MSEEKSASGRDGARRCRTEPPAEPAATPAPRTPETPVRTPEDPSGGPPGMFTRNSPEPTGDVAERRQPQAGGRGTRNLAITPASYDSSSRSVEAVLSVGAPVRRYYFTEELEISEQAIDLSRVTAGVCPLLDTQRAYAV